MSSSSSPSPERPAWAQDRWFSGWARVLEDGSECSAKIEVMGVWIMCQIRVHLKSEPHHNSGMNHNVYWDDSGYYENRIM